MKRVVVAAIVVLLGLGGLPQGQASPKGVVDPLARGGHDVRVVEYDGGRTVLGAPAGNGEPPAQPIVSDVHGALFVPSGRGPFPVMLFQHGRHETCSPFLLPDCPTTPVTRPIHSYRGYDYLAENLASNGYLVVSVDANDINDTDLAEQRAGALQRAQLISRTLDRLHDWNTAPGPGSVGRLLIGKVDLRRLGLMGHSRGGEGVTYWTVYDRMRTDGRRYGADAVFALAPIDVTRTVMSGVPWATMLPLCDGDVTPLNGAAVYDRSRYDARDLAPQAQYVLHGANHNAFNTTWTNDEALRADSRCDETKETSLRLTPAQQQQAGLAVMGSFLRRYVGGERGFDRWLTGAATFAPACHAAIPLPCAHQLRTSWLPPAAARTDVLAPDGQGSGPSTVTATGAVTATACAPAESRPCPVPEKESGTRSRDRSTGRQLGVVWQGSGSLRLQLLKTADVRNRSALLLRVAVPADARNTAVQDPFPGTAGQRFRVVLTDRHGRRATVETGRGVPALQPPPGSVVRPSVLNGMRIPLTRLRGVDFSGIQSVTLEVSGTGSIRLTDVAFL